MAPFFSFFEGEGVSSRWYKSHYGTSVGRFPSGHLSIINAMPRPQPAAKTGNGNRNRSSSPGISSFPFPPYFSHSNATRRNCRSQINLYNFTVCIGWWGRSRGSLGNTNAVRGNRNLFPWVPKTWENSNEVWWHRKVGNYFVGQKGKWEKEAGGDK